MGRKKRLPTWWRSLWPIMFSLIHSALRHQSRIRNMGQSKGKKWSGWRTKEKRIPLQGYWKKKLNWSRNMLHELSIEWYNLTFTIHVYLQRIAEEIFRQWHYSSSSWNLEWCCFADRWAGRTESCWGRLWRLECQAWTASGRSSRSRWDLRWTRSWLCHVRVV